MFIDKRFVGLEGDSFGGEFHQRVVEAYTPPSQPINIYRD
jgi:hypothetical protein